MQPSPPDTKPENGKPNFAGRPLSELNLFKEPIAPGTSAVGYHDAQPFTRFYGSVASDQPLDVTITFSNDEVDPEGRVVRDDNIDKLHYDAEALRQLYDPKKQGPTGKYFVTIFGRWIRVEVKNTGDAPTKELRVFVRGSVF